MPDNLEYIEGQGIKFSTIEKPSRERFEFLVDLDLTMVSVEKKEGLFKEIQQYDTYRKHIKKQFPSMENYHDFFVGSTKTRNRPAVSQNKICRAELLYFIFNSVGLKISFLDFWNYMRTKYPGSIKGVYPELNLKIASEEYKALLQECVEKDLK